MKFSIRKRKKRTSSRSWKIIRSFIEIHSRNCHMQINLIQFHAKQIIFKNRISFVLAQINSKDEKIIRSFTDRLCTEEDFSFHRIISISSFPVFHSFLPLPPFLTYLNSFLSHIFFPLLLPPTPSPFFLSPLIILSFIIFIIYYLFIFSPLAFLLLLYSYPFNEKTMVKTIVKTKAIPEAIIMLLIIRKTMNVPCPLPAVIFPYATAFSPEKRGPKTFFRHP